MLNRSGILIALASIVLVAAGALWLANVLRPHDNAGEGPRPDSYTW